MFASYGHGYKPEVLQKYRDTLSKCLYSHTFRNVSYIVLSDVCAVLKSSTCDNI